MVTEKTIVRNDYHVKHKRFNFKATAPAQITKTSLDYFWLLPPKFDAVVSGILKHEATGFSSFKSLKDSLRSYFSNKVLRKAGVLTRHKNRKLYSLRTIRAYRATEWVKLVMQYRVMGWKPEPPNPLSHKQWKTTLDNYAAKSSESEWEARRRCFDKYYKDPKLRQPWMEEWLRATKKQ